MSDFVQRMRLAGGLRAGMRLHAAQSLVRHQVSMFTGEIWKEPSRVVWTNMGMPPELFYAAGYLPVNTELTAGWSSTLNLAAKYLTIAEQKGFGQNLCSYHKAIIGAMECGDLPSPRLAVMSSHICDGGRGLLSYFASRFRTKTYLIQVPYGQTDEDNRYVQRQLQECYSKIARSVSWPSAVRELQSAIQCSNQARRWLTNANALRKKAVLLPGNAAIRNLFGATFLFGSALGIQITREYCQQLVELAARGEPALLEGHRILWIHFAPLYAGRLMRYFEETLRCPIAFDITGHPYWEEMRGDTPFQSLAQKMASHFFLGSSRGRIKLYRHLVQEYQIRGIVMLMHQGCKAIPASSWELRELGRQIQIPYLELPGDCVDPRSFGEEQTRLRMEAFAECLGRRQHGSGN